MIRAYQEIYLNKAQAVLGEAFDYAINVCSIPGNDFVKLFLASATCLRLEKGEPALLLGKSGAEIVFDILFETTGKGTEQEPKERFSRSVEYWIGWAVAYYQWWSGRGYSEIFKALSFENLKNMYGVLHEAPVTKFADIANERIRECFPDTNLKRMRVAFGCSQAQLAKLSGVGLRSIQMYEQRNKNINKASVETVCRLAKALGCSAEDLVEKAL